MSLSQFAQIEGRCSEQAKEVGEHLDALFHRVQSQIFTLCMEARTGRTAAVNDRNACFGNAVAVRAAARVNKLSFKTGHLRGFRDFCGQCLRVVRQRHGRGEAQKLNRLRYAGGPRTFSELKDLIFKVRAVLVEAVAQVKANLTAVRNDIGRGAAGNDAGVDGRAFGRVSKLIARQAEGMAATLALAPS